MTMISVSPSGSASARGSISSSNCSGRAVGSPPVQKVPGRPAGRASSPRRACRPLDGDRDPPQPRAFVAGLDRDVCGVRPTIKRSGPESAGGSVSMRGHARRSPGDHDQDEHKEQPADGHAGNPPLPKPHDGAAAPPRAVYRRWQGGAGARTLAAWTRNAMAAVRPGGVPASARVRARCSESRWFATARPRASRASATTGRPTFRSPTWGASSCGRRARFSTSTTRWSPRVRCRVRPRGRGSWRRSARSTWSSSSGRDRLRPLGGAHRGGDRGATPGRLPRVAAAGARLRLPGRREAPRLRGACAAGLRGAARHGGA